MFFGAIRPLLLAFVLGAAFCLITVPPVFAQSAQSADPAAGEVAPIQAEDSIAAAERALVLEEVAAVPGAGGASSIGTILRMVLTLAVAAAAIYGVIYFIKRASRRAETRDPFLKVLAGAHLGANRYAYVVAVGSKAWLVGAAEGGVNLISEIEDKDTLNALLLEDSRKSAEAAPAGRLLDFKTMLRRLGMSADSPERSGADSIRKRRERLKGL